MKKAALIAALMLAASAAQAEAYATSDEVCLSVGRMASWVAMSYNVPEGNMMNIYAKPSKPATTAQDMAVDYAMLKAIPYIYTMRFDPQQTRSIVYMKCKNGDFAPKGGQ